MRCHHSLRLSFHLLCPEIWDSFHYHQFRCRTIIRADGDYYCLSQNVFMIIYFSCMFHYLIPNLNIQHLFSSFCHDFMHVENLKILEMTGNKQFTGCPWNIYISLSFSICSKSHKQVLVFILAFHNNSAIAWSQHQAWLLTVTTLLAGCWVTGSEALCPRLLWSRNLKNGP